MKNMTKRSATERRKYRDREGLCVRCGGLRDCGKKHCRICCDKRSAEKRQQAQRRVRAGLCYYCGQNPTAIGKLGGKARCQVCLDKRVRYHLLLKLKVFEAYGGAKCACPGCNESMVEFLTIEHKNRDGAAHRKRDNLNTSGETYRWLIKNKFPPGFEVLCFNCNSARWIYGICPHTGTRHKVILDAGV